MRYPCCTQRLLFFVYLIIFSLPGNAFYKFRSIPFFRTILKPLRNFCLENLLDFQIRNFQCYHVDDLQKNPNAKPDEYWKDTSDNVIIRSFIDYAGASITKKLETLMNGGYILHCMGHTCIFPAWQRLSVCDSIFICRNHLASNSTFPIYFI